MKEIPPILPILKRYEIIISAVVVMSVTLILSITLLFPNFDRATQIFENQKVLKNRLELLQKKEQSLEKLDAASYTQSLPKIYSVLPFHKDYVSLFTRFDELQKKTGVTIVRTDFQLGVVSTQSAALAKQGIKGALVIPMSVEVIGSKDEIKQFLDSLYDLTGRLLTVGDIQWVLKDQSQMQLTVHGQAYFSLLPTTLGSIDSPLPKLDKRREEMFEKIQQIQLTSDSAQETQNVSVGKKDLFQ